MDYIKPVSIIHKSRINCLGRALIKARQSIVAANAWLPLSDTQQLRLVLLCCLYLQKSTWPVLPNRNLFKEMCNFLQSDSIGNQHWINEYLNITDTNFDLINTDEAIQYISEYSNDDTFSFLIPYALELLEYSDYDLSNATHDRRNGIITSKKKKNGIYYTPSDVIAYMVDLCIKKLQQAFPLTSLCNYRFADLSCGSGVFLLQVLCCIAAELKIKDATTYIDVIESCIFGVDSSIHAVDIAHFVILSYVTCINCDRGINYSKLLSILNKNIICADATSMNNIYEQHADYPKKFHCIIGNPPYVGTTGRSNIGSSQIVRSNLFIPFVHHLIDYSESISISTLVLPLSLAYNTYQEYNALRERIKHDCGNWVFEHYDRSPDSLFGDDVKSRNCIVIRETLTNCAKISSTGLLRWTSLGRQNFLFSNKETSDISEFSITQYIPKLGDDIEVQAYREMTTGSQRLMDILRPTSKESDTTLVIRGTAYNWICAYDHIPHTTDKAGTAYISKDLKIYATDSEETLYFSLACLNSTCLYWLWTVIGDGFHVTNRLLSTFSIDKFLFDPESFCELTRLGKEFCNKLVLYPTVSYNSGKAITNYNHLNLMHIIQQIDATICKALHFDLGFMTHLSKWYYNMVNCGRTIDTPNIIHNPRRINNV